MRLLILVLGFFAFSAPVLAAQQPLQIDVSKPNFAEQHRLVLKTINDDVKYSEISSTDRASVESSLNRIAAVLAEGKTVAMLDEAAKQKVDSDQIEVNKLLTKAFRDSRLICTSAAAVGSNMIKRTCKTAAARNRENDIIRTNGINISQ